jgi:hypothetical protein
VENRCAGTGAFGILLVFLVSNLDCFVLYFFADAVLYSNVPLFIFIFHSVRMSLKQEIEMSNHSIISLNSFETIFLEVDKAVDRQTTVTLWLYLFAWQIYNNNIAICRS